MGNPTSLNNIANFYETGVGRFKKDIDKCLYFYELAAERGFGRACWNLGRLYLEGVEVGRDLRLAEWYFQRTMYLSMYQDTKEKLKFLQQQQPIHNI